MRDGATKKNLVDALAFTLSLTREQVTGLELSPDENTVTIVFKGGYHLPVNVHLDSGIALIRDVCQKVTDH